MAEPGDEIAATAGGHSRLRASHADREQVIDILKAAFVQGRLARDEFGLRVGRALASQTYADLAALTSDIPADLIGTQPPGAAREPADKEAVTAAACVSAAWTGIWVPLVVVDGIPSLVNFVLVVVLISVVPVSLAGFLLYHAWVDKRPSRQLLQGRHRAQAVYRSMTRSLLRNAARHADSAPISPHAGPLAQDAVVVGEYERAFYGSQYAAMAPLFEHYGVQLWMPEVGGRVDYQSERDEKTMTGLGLSSKREITQDQDPGPYRDGRPDPGAGPLPGRSSAVRVPAR